MFGRQSLAEALDPALGVSAQNPAVQARDLGSSVVRDPLLRSKVLKAPHNTDDGQNPA